MEGHAIRDTRLTLLRRFWTTPFQYTLLVASVLSAKLLHLYNHISSLPPVLFILYLPTFLALDVVIVLTFWLLVHITAHGRAWMLLALVRSFICFVILGAASVQIAFYLETGGEIKWGAAGNFVSDPAAMRLLLSGGVYAFSVSIVIIGVSVLVCQRLYDGTQALLCSQTRAFGKRYSLKRTIPNYLPDCPTDPESVPSTNLRSSEGDDLAYNRQYTDTVLFETETLLVDTKQSKVSQWISRIKFLLPLGTVLLLLFVRPRNAPYAHMSGSLPFTLRDIWGFYSEGLCQEGNPREFDVFPLPELVSSKVWEQPKGKYMGWVPIANMSSMVEQENRQPPLPSWLPREKMHGFERWYGRDDQSNTLTHSPKMSGKGIGRELFERVTYDPAKDPLRITNLDHDLLQPITDALAGRKIPIKHVVVVHLESTRKDVFPLKEGSHLHNLIMKSHTSNESMTEVNKKLSKLTVNAEQLTGEESGFQSSRKHSESLTRSGTWRELSQDRGGINVVGAFTGSTTTFKSMIGSHCGAQPLPVDFTVEARGNIYQPCIPNILKLFNHNKKPRKEQPRGILGKGGFSSQPWKSAFVQSITDLYDHQDELNKHMGFDQVVVKSTLDDPSSKYYPPTEKESNYFGYPESQVKDYMRDLFVDAEKNGERLFLSHFTSSTHHPWNVPEAAGDTFDFLKRGRWRSEHQLNRYLNTIKYSDDWIGELMDMLEEVGVAKETLVVMIGDHGMAFEEDAPKHSTFENGHISNIRVPLLFHHPSLPRVQLGINATSLSVIPTILDLLTATSSLNTQDSDIASNLIHQYEGQSLLRPYQVSKNGRQTWIVTVLNAGGAILSVSSAAVPHRLVLPVCKSGVYRFTSTGRDPNELHPIEEYSISELAARIAKEYDEAAAKWVVDAEKIGKWWVVEQRRRWRYTGASLQDDRKPEELRGAGTVKKEHWWNT